MLSSKQKFYLLVMAMGFLGACCRYALELAFYNPDGMPFGTLIINIAGCFVMEIVNLYLVRRTHAPAALTKAIGTGFVGAFTTLSAISTEMMTFLLGGRYGMALLYVSLTLVTTVLASLAGKGCVALMLGRKMRVLQARRERASQLRRAAQAGNAGTGGSVDASSAKNAGAGSAASAGAGSAKNAGASSAKNAGGDE